MRRIAVWTVAIVLGLGPWADVPAVASTGTFIPWAGIRLQDVSTQVSGDYAIQFIRGVTARSRRDKRHNLHGAQMSAFRKGDRLLRALGYKEYGVFTVRVIPLDVGGGAPKAHARPRDQSS